MGLATLDPTEGATDLGPTTPPKAGPPLFAAGVLDWSQPFNVAAPTELVHGEPPTESERRAEAVHPFGGGPMSERPEGRVLVAGAKEGAQLAPLDEPLP